MFPGPIIELHISNIHKREPIYHKSYMSAVVTAIIAGLGPNGYPTAVRAIRALVERWRAEELTSSNGAAAP